MFPGRSPDSTLTSERIIRLSSAQPTCSTKQAGAVSRLIPFPLYVRCIGDFAPATSLVGVGAACEQRRFWETAPDFFSSFSEEDTKRAEEKGLCAVLRETAVSLVTPNDIVAHIPAGRTVNYLTIDTEGLDGEILRNWPWN